MLNRIYHLGCAVEDIEAASRFYSENFGVEPGETEVVEEQGVVATTFRVGESMIELVQPTRPDSPVGRFLERRGGGGDPRGLRPPEERLRRPHRASRIAGERRIRGQRAWT